MVAKQQKKVCKNSIAIHMKWWILKPPPNQCIKIKLTSYHGSVRGPQRAVETNHFFNNYQYLRELWVHSWVFGNITKM